MDFLLNVAPLIGGVLTLLTGLVGLLAPVWLARFLLGASAEPLAAPAARLLLGGPRAALGAFSLVSRSPSAFWAVGSLWLGALLVRIVQANLGGQPYAWRPALLEGLASVLLLGSYVASFA